MDKFSSNRWLRMLKEAFAHWSSHKASRLGAALSYYTIFSLAPLLLVIVSVTGLFLDPAVAEGGLSREIGSLIGDQGAAFVTGLLAQSHQPAAGALATLVGLLVLIIGASGVLTELKTALDDFWDSERTAKKHKGFFAFVRSRFLTLSMIPVLVFLLLISLAFSAFLAAASVRLTLLPGLSLLLRSLNALYTLATVGALFACIYRFLPDTKLPWRETILGGGATALLFIIGKSLIGFYLTSIADTSSFGAAGALIAVMVWVYYSVQIFLLGASLIYVYSSEAGYLKQLKTARASR